MKNLWHHVLLAIAGLGAAWWVYSGGDEEERPAEEVVVFECDTGALTAIEFEAEHKKARLEARAGEGDEARSFWITVERTPENGEATTERFVGSDAAEEIAAKLAPLRAIRSLGEVDEALLEELKLSEPDTHLSIECGGQTRRYAIGETQFGEGDRYMRAADGGPVYLLSADLVRDLESAEFRLMQRDLHRFEPTEVETLVVHAFDRDRTLLQRHRLDPERAEWVDSATPDQRNELYGNWLDRLSRLRVQSYLAPDAAPGSDLTESAPATPVATLTYADGRGREIGRLELVRVEAAEPQYYARTEATRSWVKVLRSVAQQIEDDTRPVVGLEAIVREEPPAATPDAGVGAMEGPTAVQAGADGGVAAHAPVPAPGISPTVMGLAPLPMPMRTPQLGGASMFEPPPSPAAMVEATSMAGATGMSP